MVISWYLTPGTEVSLVMFLSYLRRRLSMDYDFFSFYIYYEVGWHYLAYFALHKITLVFKLT